MDKEQINSENQHGNGRRSFIKKASVAAGVSILPASNVWGTCNATGVSGGSQDSTTSCVVDSYDGGRSPGTWRKFVKNNPSESDKKRIATIVSGMHWQDRFSTGSKQRKIDFYYPRLKAFIDSKTIRINGGGSIPSKTISVTAAIKSTNSLEKHMACTFLNGLFEMNHGLNHEYTGPSGTSLFMEHVWGSAKIGSWSHTQNRLSSSYNDSKTCTMSTFVNCLAPYI